MEDVELYGLPGFAILNIASPVDEWAKIMFIDNGHFLAPSDKYKWISANGVSYAFSAFGLEHPINGLTPSAYFFTNQSVRKLDGADVNNVNKMLQLSTETDAAFKDVYQLDIMSILAFRYNVFFFIQDNEPAWVLGCVDNCNKSIHLKVEKN